MRKRSVAIPAFAFLVLWMTAGCGYRFAGSGSYPAGIQKIHIQLLDNRTTETGIEKNITDDLINEFIRRNAAGVAGNSEDADAILSGVIGAMSVETISRTAATESDERRVTLTLYLKLTGAKKRVIWSGAVSENQAYPVAGDRLATDANRRAAILVLSTRLAEKVYNRLTADF